MRARRPFWLPASNYYVLTIAASSGIFFLVWGILQDGQEEAPWIIAGGIASGTIFGAVLLREVFLRSARNRFLVDQRRLDRTLHAAAALPRALAANPDKLTLEKNALILSQIRQKSEAAKVLGKFSEAHREVFEMCSEYLGAAERELPTVGPGSPRIVALLKGKELVNQYQHYHLLQWAEIEARSLTLAANNSTKVSERFQTAQKALGVVDFALGYYPTDPALRGSETVLKEFVASLKVSHLIEKAEKANFRGQHARALSHYGDALFYLQRDVSASPDSQAMERSIVTEIDKLQRAFPDIKIKESKRKSSK